MPQPHADPRIHRTCRACRYDLTGLALTGTCPECGQPFNHQARESPHDVAALISAHNRENVVMLIVYLIGALIAWPLSYLTSWWIAAVVHDGLFEYVLERDGYPWLPHAFAIIVVAGLAIRVLLDSRHRFDAIEIADSPAAIDRANPGAAYATGYIFTWSVILTNILLAAPRVSRLALERSHLFVALPDRSTLAGLQEAVETLWQSGKWMDVKTLGIDGDLAIQLKTAGIVWIDEKPDRLRIRLDPSLCR